MTPLESDDEVSRAIIFIVLIVVGLSIAICIAGCGASAQVYSTASAPAQPTAAECRAEFCPNAFSVEVVDVALVLPSIPDQLVCECDCTASDREMFVTGWPPSPEYLATAQANWSAFCAGGDQ